MPDQSLHNNQHYRSDIQALRGVAVLLVLIYHMWPKFLPGGYIGVDIFFVISGYLITGLLIREANSNQKISLCEFYARRIARLFPTANFVLLFCILGITALSPDYEVSSFLKEVVASSLYIQNWMLADLSLDYLKPETLASPVQHYWSLSIEEQFYLAWPLIILIVLKTTNTKNGFYNKLLACFFFIFIISLYFSTTTTVATKELAYFATHTRMWELALGGICYLFTLKFIHAPRPYIQFSLILLGLVFILASSLLYSEKTLFPGYSALLPTFGAALIIIGNSQFQHAKFNTLHYLGDRSYSIYLWHFPVIIFYKNYFHVERLGIINGVVLFIVILLFSHASYKHIEQKYRKVHKGQAKLAILHGLQTTIAICLTCFILLDFNQSNVNTDLEIKLYPGANALMNNEITPQGVELLPPLKFLRADNPSVYGKCHQNQASSDPIYCSFGNSSAQHIMVLWGDSHAAQWVPALEAIALQKNWKLVTFTKSACGFSDTPSTLNGHSYPSCTDWKDNVLKTIASIQPSLIITSEKNRTYVELSVRVAGLRNSWERMKHITASIYNIEDTPMLDFDPAECLSRHASNECKTPRKLAISEPATKLALITSNFVSNIDMTNTVCDEEYCYSAVGNLISYRDEQHLSATFSKSLAPFLLRKIEKNLMNDKILPDNNGNNQL